MAQIIRLKRHIGSALTPTAGVGATQLSVGEVAYERQSAAHATNPGPDNLWVSDGVGVHPLVSNTRQVELSGAQTIAGTKTFSAFPVFPAGVANQVLTTTDAAGTLAWAAPVAVPPALVLRGEFDASSGTTGVVANAVAPLTNGPLPAVTAALEGSFVIVSVDGTPTTGNAPQDHLAVGDWIVATWNGTTGAWIHINLHFAIVAASAVAVNPAIAGQTDVQAALTFLNARRTGTGATDPVAGMQAGDLFLNTTAPATLKIYNGTAWVAVGDGQFLPLTGGTVTGQVIFDWASATTDPFNEQFPLLVKAHGNEYVVGPHAYPGWFGLQGGGGSFGAWLMEPGVQAQAAGGVRTFNYLDVTQDAANMAADFAFRVRILDTPPFDALLLNHQKANFGVAVRPISQTATPAGTFAAADAGALWWDSTAGQGLKVFNGTAWNLVTPAAPTMTVTADQVSITGNGAATGTGATGPLLVALVDGGTYA